MNGISAQGMVFIHSAHRALLPHLEWTIGRVFGQPIPMRWQPIDQDQFRAEFHWQGNGQHGSELAAELMGWKTLRFEVTQQDHRWSYTPNLGLFHSDTDEAGNILVNEFRLMNALESSGSNAIELQRQMRILIGQPWDDELEKFRISGENAPIIWLRSVAN